MGIQENLGNREPVRAPLDGSPITVSAFSPPGRPYQICISCVMDTTDVEITFDENGVCSYCSRFANHRWPKPSSDRDAKIPRLLEEAVNSQPKGTEYDCILGMSGGVDSSYLVHKVVEWGLKPLIFHVDAGWNSEVAVSNIHRIVTTLNLDLITEVIEWDVMRRLQLAYLRSGLANLDVPQDHAFFSSLHKVAAREGIKLILSGHNLATESVLPRTWGYDAMDGRQIRAIHSLFGEGDLSGYPVTTLFQHRVVWPKLRRYHSVAPLNEIYFDRSSAVQTLGEKYGWVDYGQKHFESVWTRYFQAAFLPYRFGYDKRKAHLSSQIIVGSLSRGEALESLKKSLYADGDLARDEQFISNKLGIDSDTLSSIREQQLSHFSDFPNDSLKMKAVYSLMSFKSFLQRRSLLRRYSRGGK